MARKGAKDNKIRTTIYVYSQTWLDIQKVAAEDGFSASCLLEQLARRYLKDRKKNDAH
jgi:hypothetical protein